MPGIQKAAVSYRNRRAAAPLRNISGTVAQYTGPCAVS